MKHNIFVLLLFIPSLCAMNEIPRDDDGYLLLENYKESELPNGPVAIYRDQLGNNDSQKPSSIRGIVLFSIPVALAAAATAKRILTPDPEPIPPTVYESAMNSCISLCKGIFQLIHR